MHHIVLTVQCSNNVTQLSHLVYVVCKYIVLFPFLLLKVANLDLLSAQNILHYFSKISITLIWKLSIKFKLFHLFSSIFPLQKKQIFLICELWDPFTPSSWRENNCFLFYPINWDIFSTTHSQCYNHKQTVPRRSKQRLFCIEIYYI